MTPTICPASDRQEFLRHKTGTVGAGAAGAGAALVGTGVSTVRCSAQPARPPVDTSTSRAGAKGLGNGQGSGTRREAEKKRWPPISTPSTTNDSGRWQEARGSSLFLQQRLERASPAVVGGHPMALSTASSAAFQNGRPFTMTSARRSSQREMLFFSVFVLLLVAIKGGPGHQGSASCFFGGQFPHLHAVFTEGGVLACTRRLPARSRDGKMGTQREGHSSPGKAHQGCSGQGGARK